MSAPSSLVAAPAAVQFAYQLQVVDVPQPPPDVVPTPPTPHPVQTPDTPPEISPEHPPEVIEPSLPGEHAPVRDPIVPGDTLRL